jgi:hypothetical protein
LGASERRNVVHSSLEEIDGHGKAHDFVRQSAAFLQMPMGEFDTALHIVGIEQRIFRRAQAYPQQIEEAVGVDDFPP